MKEHWRVNLDGYGATDGGFVVTRDGEVIGRWEADANDILSFTPLDGSVPVLTNAFCGPFCSAIANWHRLREGSAP